MMISCALDMVSVALFESVPSPISCIRTFLPFFTFFSKSTGILMQAFALFAPSSGCINAGVPDNGGYAEIFAV